MVAIPTQTLVSAAYVCSSVWVVCVCLPVCSLLEAPVYSMALPKNTSGRIPNGIMGRGRVQNPRAAEGSPRLHWSPPLPFYFPTPPSFFSPLFNPGVPPLLTLSPPLSRVHLCPLLSIHLPSLSFFPPSANIVGNWNVCMCVTEGVTCDQAGTVAV